MTTRHEAVAALKALLDAKRQANRLLRLDFPSNDGPEGVLLVANRLDADEGLSRDFVFKVEVLSDSPSIALKDLMGKMATLALRRVDGSIRYFNGHVFDFRFVKNDAGFAFYEMVLRPWLAFLQYRRDNYLFHGKTVEQQTDSIFRDYEMRDWHLGSRGIDEPMTEACQWDESDYNYQHRRWEARGWHYRYEHRADGHTLMLSGDSRTSPPIDGDGEIEWQGSSGIRGLGLSAWSQARTVASTHYTASSFDFKNPRPQTFDQPTLNKQGRMPRLEVYEYAGAYAFERGVTGKDLTRRRIEAIEAQAEAVSGWSTREIGGRREQQLRFDDTTGQISAQVASDHGHSQLNLGYLTQPHARGCAEPRGEGAELRSDDTVAMRGGRGVLISSATAPGGSGSQLERAELVGLTQALQAIVEQLGTLASAHHAADTDPAKLRQLVRHLQDWEKGSNTAPDQGPGRAPIVAVSAAAGAGIVSQDNLVLGAQTHVDLVSAGHAQFTAGQQIRQRAEAGLSLFAHTGGIEAVAGKGPVGLQAHQGGIQLTASDSIVLTAGKKIVIQAPEVQIVSRGAQTQWGGGSVVEQASGAFVVKSASFSQTGGGDGTPAPLDLPSSDLKFDQQVMLRWTGTHEPMKNQRYRITTESGRSFEGRTDGTGMTARFPSDIAYGLYTIEPLDD